MGSQGLLAKPALYLLQQLDSLRALQLVSLSALLRVVLD